MPRHGTTEPVAQLQLSALLAQLGAEARTSASLEVAPGEVATDGASVAVPQDRSARRRRRKRIPSNVTLGEIVDRTEHAGFGFLVAFLTLVSIPFVGMSLPFGLAVALVAAQMIAGRNRPWLPRRLRRRVVSVRTLEWLSQRVTRWTRGLERWIRPRWTVLARGPFWVLVGIGLFIQGLGLAIPSPLPGSNGIFAIAIVLYGIGLLEDDGLLILVGHIMTAVELVLAVVFWNVVAEGVTRAYHWFSGFVS